MTYHDPYTSSPYDQELANSPALTWVPWVGKNFSSLPSGRKVLIVAESHYSNEQSPEKAPLSLQATVADKTYTRAVVFESLVNEDWTTRTLSTMHQLFYSPQNREAFWNDVAFFNIVQRPMWYREGNPERPTWEDFWKGWEAFLKVVEILKPDHVLFIGVEAANHFNGFMSHHGREHIGVEWVEKVGSAYARTAKLVTDGAQTPLHFIKHCGSYFSTGRWADYLHRNARDLMASIAISANSKMAPVAVRRLHVLGMAKSCLDLRGANAPKLELDFLRLLLAIRDFEEVGEEAVGYLVVLDEKVEARANSWRVKYGIGDKIIVKRASFPDIQLDDLRKEKVQNAIGMLTHGSSEDAEKELSVATLGKEMGELALAELIRADYPNVSRLHESLSRTELPLQVAWDYYGSIALEN